jgi:hypothetical protein
VQVLALSAARGGRSCLPRDDDQAAGFGCSRRSWRREAAAMALKRAIRKNIFIGRFTVSVVTRRPARLPDDTILRCK